MPREITLSTMIPADMLDLTGYAERRQVTAHHRPINWTTGWNEVLQFGLYQKGPDVSEVGSTWLDNLNDMRALRPFSTAEINTLGGAKAFFSNAWPVESYDPAVLAAGPTGLTSIPWLMDTRLIHYRRDLLAKAGVAEKNAFATPDAMYDTLLRLQKSGQPYPLAMATGGLSLHNLAGFVWGRGGHFRSEDYHKVTLVEPQARRGMVDYFQLHRFIAPEIRGKDYGGADVAYFSGQAAVLLSGQWAMKMIKEGREGIAAPVVRNSGYAMVPGMPYVGGTHLVIWRHVLHDQEAIQLVDHLTAPGILSRIFQQTGNFPARLATLNNAPFAGDADYQLVIECLRQGRTFRTRRLWAGVEMRISQLCDQLWNDLFAQPDLNLEAEIETRVGDLANRLEKTLLANW